GLDVALAWRRDDDLLRAGGDVAGGLRGIGEQAGGLDHVVHAEILPREPGGVARGGDALDLVAIHDQNIGLFVGSVAFGGLDGVLELAVDGIITDLVGEVVGVGGHVDDGDDVQFLAQQALVADRLKHHAADTAKAVDSNFDGHGKPPPRSEKTVQNNFCGIENIEDARRIPKGEERRFFAISALLAGNQANFNGPGSRFPPMDPITSKYNATIDSIEFLTPDLFILKVRPDKPVTPFISGQYVLLGLSTNIP